MEVVHHTKDHSLAIRNFLDLVSPLPGNLYGRLDSLRARVHGQNHIIAKHSRDSLGEFGKDIVVEGSTAQCQPLCLIYQSFD